MMEEIKDIDMLESTIPLPKCNQEKVNQYQEWIDELKTEEAIKIGEIAESIGDGSIIHNGTSIIINYTVDSKEDIVEILREFGKLGYKQTSEPRDGADYRFYRLGSFALYFYFTGAKCRYVKKGTKVVDVMELVCD